MNDNFSEKSAYFFQKNLFLNQVLAAIRFNISESSKFSSFFLLYNRDVALPIDNLQPRRKYVGEEYHQIALQE